MTRAHRATAVAIALLAGCAASGLLAGCASSELPEDWVALNTGDLVLGVDVTGALKAVDSDTLGPPPVPRMWDFKISMMAPEGQAIEQGAPALGFDTSDLQRQLLEKQNERDAAAKELEKRKFSARMSREAETLAIAEAQAKLRKNQLKADVPADLTSAAELRKVKLDRALAEQELRYARHKAEATKRRDAAEIAALKDQRDRAEQRVAEIQSQIEKMTRKAPRAGTVIYAPNWRGEKKKVGDNAWRAEQVLEIVSLDKMKALGEIDEMDGSKVAPGQRVEFRLDAHPDIEYTGKVTVIMDTVGQKDQDNPVKIVKLDIALDQTEPLRMRPGMRFRGTIEYGRKADVLLLPADAVFVKRDGPVAYRRAGDDYETVSVTLGERNPYYVEVVAGLGVGDHVSRVDLAAAGARSAR